MKTKFKIVLLGVPGVGKTSIMNRLVNGTFYEYIESTIGALFFNVKQYVHNNIMIDMQIWDTAGQERYRSLIPMYTRSSDVILLVYDVSDTNIDDLKFWYRFITRSFSINEMPLVYLVGNKSDITNMDNIEKNKKIVDESVNLSQVSITDHIITSAKSGDNIDDLFQKISVNLFDMHNKKCTDDVVNTSIQDPIINIDANKNDNNNDKYYWYPYGSYIKSKYCCM